MPKKKIAIVLGGTPDHVSLIEVLKNKGFYVFLIDYYENPPAKEFAHRHIRESTLDKDLVLQIARQESASLVVATCIESALTTMAYVCEELDLPCHISYETALKLTNKAEMKRIFVNNDIPTTKHVVLTEQDIGSDLAKGLSSPLVVKPADANSSKGVVKVRGNEELDRAVQEAFGISRSGQVVVEEFFEGEEFSVDVAVKDHKPSILMATKMIKTSINPNNFTIIQNTYPATNDTNLLGSIEIEVAKITKAYGIKEGPLLVQLLSDGSKIRIVEFSARIGGGSKHSFLRHMTGFDAVEYFVNILTGETYSKMPTVFNGYGSMNYVYAHPGIIEKFVGFKELKEAGAIDEVFYYKMEGSEVNAAVSSGDRPVGFLVTDCDLESLNRRIKEADECTAIIDNTGSNLKISGLYTEVR